MDEKEIKETKVWVLYNKATEYARKKGFYSEIDKCNNFYNGDQWEGLLVEGIEPVQYNFIKPIVNYKVGMITENLRAINYSADNVEGTKFRNRAKKVCDLFNQRAARVWEKDQMDIKCKKLVRQAAINGESIVYVSYDEVNNNPLNEIINKVDIYYANENDPDIQNQPYILVKQRVTVEEAQQIAKQFGASQKVIDNINGDDDTTDEAGNDAKEEVNNNVTIVTKFFKEDGKVKYEKATKYVEITQKVEDSGLSLYPVAHYLWTDKEGSARGEGEVRGLIANQIETNKTAMRRLLTAKNTAYPQKIYNKDKIANPEAINIVGGVIEAEGMEVDDVRKAFSVTQPAQMSPDVEKLQNELISTTRELASASDTATGQVNPEDASGRAILAVQQASKQPLNDQSMGLDTMLEDVARIWLDIWKTYNSEGMKLEDITTDPLTGEEKINIIDVQGSILDKLKTTVKIDITPKGAFDKYAQEMSLENLAKSEFFMNTAWLKDYVSLLDNDSVMPKLKIEDLIKKREEAQARIRAVQEQAAMLQQGVNKLMQTGQIMPQEMAQYMGGQPAMEQPMQQQPEMDAV